MTRKCPLCGQTLPEAISDKDLRLRKDRLAAAAVACEKDRLKRSFDREYHDRWDRERRSIEARAQQKVAQQYEARVRDAERHAERKLERQFEKELADAKRGAAQAAKAAVRETKAQLDSLKASRDQERGRTEREKAGLRARVEELTRKLERRTSESLGEEGELDLYARLTGDFPGDRIERVGRGVKGADVLHYVMNGDAEIGRIVYESKNVATWQNAFVTRAKAYRSQYRTPYVFIVTRAFPHKNRGLCVVNGVPVVDPGAVSVLVELLRDSMLEIAHLRGAGSTRVTEAQALFDYILSDDFQTKFREVAETVKDLRDLQEKERDWHANHWTKQGSLYEQIGTQRREIDNQLKTLTGRSLRVARATA